MLNLKKLSRFGALPQAVRTKSLLQRVRVRLWIGFSFILQSPYTFPDTGRVEYSNRRGVFRDFEYDQNAQLRWKLIGQCDSLSALPAAVKIRIYNYATTTSKGIVFGLDSCPTHGLNFPLLRTLFKTKRVLQESYATAKALAKTTSVTLELESDGDDTEFGVFESLTRAMTLGCNSDHPSRHEMIQCIAGHSLSRTSTSTIILRLHNNHAGSKEYRIKLNKFIAFLGEHDQFRTHDNHLRIHDNTKIAIAPSNCEEYQDVSSVESKPEATYGSLQETASMTVRGLKIVLFLYFTDILNQTLPINWPELPDICIDETGTIVDMTPPLKGCPSLRADSWEYSVDGKDLIAIAARIRDQHRACYPCVCSRQRGQFTCMASTWESLLYCAEREWGCWDEALGRHTKRKRAGALLQGK